eukprot:TRINITY_DN4472_c0_g1_i8.p1 TRINITY_DN4472_c0_g1~~TRINITY_DN4472_c0_g1_i8.p1  ORF type:complete len:567 (+),score=91.58 TRINITY_DN4472_c0_g1_i8:135-1835(+)
MFSSNGAQNGNAITTEQLNNFVNLSKQNEEVVKKVSGKDVILMIGSTGAGKSTTINALCGCQMVNKKQKNNQGRFITVVDAIPQNGFIPMAIGNTSTSETLIANIAVDPATGVVFVDCPGHKDNRGWEIALVNSVNILSIIQACKGVKIVLVIPAASYHDVRGASIKDIMKSLNHLLSNVGGLKANLQHIALVVTKASRLEDVQNVESVVCEVEPLFKDMVLGLSFEDPKQSKYLEADFEGDSHPGTVEDLKRYLQIETSFAHFDAMQLNAPITDEDRHVLLQLQDVVRGRVQEAGFEQITEAVQLYSAITALTIIKSKEVDVMLQNMKQQFIRLFEKKISKLSIALNARDIDSALCIKDLLISTLATIRKDNPKLHDYIAKERIVENCEDLIQKVQEFESELEAERVAKQMAEQQAHEAQMAKQAAEAAAEKEHKERLEAQQAAQMEHDARVVVEQQAAYERKENERRAEELVNQYEQSQRQNQEAMNQLAEQAKKVQEEQNQRLLKEQEEREQLAKKLAEQQVNYERQLREAAQREAEAARAAAARSSSSGVLKKVVKKVKKFF